MRSLQKKWRDNKCRLKKRYYEGLIEERHGYVPCPPNFVPRQWYTLIDYWSSNDSKKKCERGKANRSKQMMPHTSGSKSFVRVAVEMQANNPSNVPASRKDIFVKTHRHKDGTPVDAMAAVKIHEMEEIQEQAPENYEDCISPNDIYARVMGRERHGRVRCSGTSVTPTQLWGSTSSSSTALYRNSEVERLQEEVSTMKDKLTAMEKMLEQHFTRQDVGSNLQSKSLENQQQISRDEDN